MRIKARKAIAIHDEEQIKIEFVTGILFQKIRRTCSWNVCGIEKRKQRKKHKERGIQNSTLETEKALTKIVMEENLKS